MRYEFECRGCGESSEFVVPLAAYDILKRDIHCQCGGEIRQILSVRRPINRTGMPKNFMSEHLNIEPQFCRDYSEFKGIAAENDLTITNPWDGI